MLVTRSGRGQGTFEDSQDHNTLDPDNPDRPVFEEVTESSNKGMEDQANQQATISAPYVQEVTIPSEDLARMMKTVKEITLFMAQ